jgi:cytochrome c oxidase subunit IV
VAHAQAQQVGHAGGLPAAPASSEHVGHADEQHAAHAGAHAGSHAQGQQHPLGIYFKIWGLLFVLSVGSYLVDFFHVHGYLRWSLIVVLMLLKAGLIVAVFMHMLWERLALMYAIVVPPVLLLVLLGIGAFEADYTFLTRGTFFAPAAQAQAPAKQH